MLILMNEIKEEKIKEILRQTASEFFKLESSGGGLITVTAVKLSGRGRRALILFTVFPSEKERGALDFAKRKRSAFREFLQKESALARLPFVDFAIDLGEKNRQKIDSLSQI